ncbi:MAG: RluA family pseudouridine synthase [Zoogloeaceae bacterium]|jgi:23S rRNA pseudouridine955/2504/2580 synthase|nr:RluA family pseudouridine synthase [Zoogloeaceae bacterium]
MTKSGKKSTPLAVTYQTVAAEESGQRLDNYLFRHCKGVPKSHIYRILRGGEARINKKRCAADYRVREGDTLRLPPLRLGGRAADDAPPAPFVDFPILYEDAALLVIDKPAGVAVHGGSGVSFGVIETLRRQRTEARFLELAHRLDKETSGLLLIGKKRSALNALHAMFRAADGQAVDKRYLMLVRGAWTNPAQQVNMPLCKYLTESGERRVRVDAEEGKAARSVFRLLARWRRFSLLEGQLKTGRTHQLRVHLAHLGFPILGDEKYGDFALNKTLRKEGLKRMALHAARLDFPHPQEDRRLTLVAPLPAALSDFIRHLDAAETRSFSAREMANIA